MVAGYRHGPLRSPEVTLVGTRPHTVCPARHVGSVDVFLEAFESAAPGDVLVVDNGGQLDHACVGDLVVLAARTAGLSGVVIWGLHRDTVDILAIGLPVFSMGTLPTGPLRVTERAQADRIRSGVTLRSQVRFDTFLTERARRPSLTFREHLREVGGAIEV